MTRDSRPGPAAVPAPAAPAAPAATSSPAPPAPAPAPAPAAMAGAPTVAGAWKGRPKGVPAAVPPPSVPLPFLVAAGLGLIACGVALVVVRGDFAPDPTADQVAVAVHLGVLATLSMGVLGAMHQFVPVVTGRPLRSIVMARSTLVTWLGAAWMIPLGIAVEQETVVEIGGALAGIAVTLAVVNLAKPLMVRGKGAPVIGLRFALAGFVATACYGLLYVSDRSGAWFHLLGHVVLAHALVGFFGWIGLTYVAVAEKLWPMFFLAHAPKRRAGYVAVWAIPAGVVLVSPGVLLGIVPLAAAGAGVLAVGLGAHFTSLGAQLRHRRRAADLHLAFVVTSAVWLVVGAGLALAGVVVMGNDHTKGMALVAGAVVALGGWVLETLAGHVHKVVPFILWSVMRAKGVTSGPTGKPLMFADLYDHAVAKATYATVTVGIAALCIGVAGGLPAATALGGVLLALTGAGTLANLALGPVRLEHRRAHLVAPGQPGASDGLVAGGIG